MENVTNTQTQVNQSTQTNLVGAVAAQSAQSINVMALLAYLGVLVFIPMLAEKQDPFVKYHSRQGLALFILSVAFWIAQGLTAFVGSYLEILWLGTSLYILVGTVLGIINVIKGEMKPLPLIGQYAEKLNI